MTSLATYFIQPFEKEIEDPDLFETCCVTKERHLKEDMYYNTLPGEWFLKTEIETWLDQTGVEGTERIELRNHILKENENRH